MKDVFAKQDKNKAVDIFQVGNITKLSIVLIKYLKADHVLCFIYKSILTFKTFFSPLKANFNPSQGYSSVLS